MNNITIICEKKESNYFLKLSHLENQVGIIYRATAVLFAYGWDILEANFEISENNLIEDIFLIRNNQNEEMTEISLKKIQTDLEELFFKDLKVIDYLERFPALTLTHPESTPPFIKIYNPSTIDCTVLDIRTSDRPGLLFEISQLLYLLDIDIISVTAKTEDQMVRDSFLLRMNQTEMLDLKTMEKLEEGLAKIL
ncbi:MAG: hypothetical protein KDK36_18125 [Leptospiraceae bacterium]|nr:hypothetical protein [Leptospiraceae bacterium]